MDQLHLRFQHFPNTLYHNTTDMSELTELFQFLDSPNPAARQIALQNLLGHTAKNDPQRHIFIPSVTGGLGGGGLLPQKRKDGAGDDERKIKGLRDLCGLCRDQPVSEIQLAPAAIVRWDQLTP